MTGFKITDDVSDDDIVIGMSSATTSEITEDSFKEFFQAGEEKPVEFKIQSSGEKERVAELMDFVCSRIVHAIVVKKWRTEYVIDHTTKMLVDLVHHLELPALNNPRSNAIGLWRKAKLAYMRDEILKSVTTLNESVGLKINGAILNPEKPRFGAALFNSLAENVESDSPDLQFTYKAGRKEEVFRYDDALNLKAIQNLKSEIVKIKKAAKAASRSLTDEEFADCQMLQDEISSVWAKFFEGSKTAIANAHKLFPETISTGRTTTSAVFKSAATRNSISFGAFEL